MEILAISDAVSSEGKNVELFAMENPESWIERCAGEAARDQKHASPTYGTTAREESNTIKMLPK